MKLKHLLIVITVFILGTFLRTVGLNWDQNQHQHPDERFLTIVATSLSWPKSILEYFDTSASPVNPHNQKFGFYVYGTYPVLITKFIAEAFEMGDYTNLTLVGRSLSAILDSLIIILVYAISRKIFPKANTIAYWSAFIYAVAVLPLQLSHFFAVDTYLVFFIALSFYLFVLFYNAFPSRKSYLYSVFLGIAFGFALGAKISGITLLLTLFSGFLILLYKHKKILPLIFSGIIFLIFSFLSLRVTQPYLFADSHIFTLQLNPKLLSNWKDLSFQSQPNHYAPPSTQWIHITKGMFPLLNIIFIGLGIPLSIFCIGGTFISPWLIPRKPLVFLISFFVVSLFIYQSFQFAQPLRYFYPIYPFLALLGGIFLSRITTKKQWLNWLFIPLFLIWPLSFISIYTRPHSRVTASTWIYENIPSGSVISCDYWDDCLPLQLPNTSHGTYHTLELHLYDRDNPEKWNVINSQLQELDYLIISSNRLYGSITADSEYYPQTTIFYQNLFAGKLGFQKIAEFASRPTLKIPFVNLCLTPPWLIYGQVSSSKNPCPNTGLTIIDDYVDESFTVYDHPKISIFKNNSNQDGVQFLD